MGKAEQLCRVKCHTPPSEPIQQKCSCSSSYRRCHARRRNSYV